MLILFFLRLPPTWLEYGAGFLDIKYTDWWNRSWV